MQHFKIVMALIEQGNNYLLQLRNGQQQAGGLNLVGCFGGQIEDGETPEQALIREVAEESSLHLQTADLEHIGTVRVRSERHNKPITVDALIYRTMIPRPTKVEAREGELVLWTEEEVRYKLAKLTPATRACFEQLIWK
jgi:ADP-ribose pyrophosphatase YjhB (NUDIX family)